MISRVAMRALLVVTFLAMLRAASLDLRLFESKEDYSDFSGYYTAACLIQSHHNPEIYEAARRGVDPVKQGASPDSAYARMARERGVRWPGLYDYPPTLADLLVPLTRFSYPTALVIWRLLNVAGLLSAGIILSRLLAMTSQTQACLVTVSLFLFHPSLECLYWGQASILILFLVLAGFDLLLREHTTYAGLLLSLAVAIKLTPIILLVPFVVWKDWKILRAMALWGAFIFTILLAINGGEAVGLYFLHEIPLMGSRSSDIDIRTLINTTQMLWHQFGSESPLNTPLWLGRLLSILVICAGGWMSQMDGGRAAKRDSRIEVLFIFLLLSCCIAPVSWIHGYVLSAPAILVLSRRAWGNRSSVPEQILLVLFLLSLCSGRLVPLAASTPILGIAIGFLKLRRLKIEQNPIEREAITPSFS